MRNQPQPLSTLGLANVCRVSDVLFSAQSDGHPVRVTYIKRDGSHSESTGVVGFFNGDPDADTFSVTVETEDKGPRTVNVARILDVFNA